MTMEFGFVEYTYDPRECSERTMMDCLHNLGFRCRAKNENNNVTIWHQNNSMIMLREAPETMGITGLGFLADRDFIESATGKDLAHDGLNVLRDPLGTRIILVNIDEEIKRSGTYKQITDSKVPTLDLDRITGVTYLGAAQDNILHFYKKLGFSVSKLGSNYHQLTSSDRKFTIMTGLCKKQPRIQNIILDTHDIFTTTAKFVANQIHLQEFEIEPSELNFGKLTHRILAYNCKALGDTEKYTIENFAPDALKNLDIIMRMRKQFIHISEQNLEAYYGKCELDEK